MDSSLLTDLIITSIKDEDVHTTFSSRRKARVTNRKRWGVLVKLTGETIYTGNGKRYLCNQNNVIIAPKGCDYEYVSIVEGEFAFMNFESPLDYPELIQIPVKNCQMVYASIQKIQALGLNKPHLYQISRLIEAYTLLYQLLKNITPKYVMPAKQRKIQSAMDYLLSNYTHDISNDELAAQTEFSTSYFRKLFHDVYGVSPLQYLLNLRIRKAKELLRSNTSSISEIAVSLGFPNVYDFSRTFKRETGLSPSAYARSKR